MDAAALLDSTPHAVLLLSELGVITYTNASARELLDLQAADDSRELALLDLVDGTHQVRAARLLDQLLSGDAAGPVQLRLATGRDVGELWVAVRGVAVPGGGAQLAIVDITDRALSDERLRRSELRFRSAFDEGSTGMAIVDVDGRFLRVNRALAQMLDRPPEWFPGRNADEVTLTDDLPGNAEANRLLRGGSETVRLAKRYVRPDGTVRYGRLKAARIEGDDGEQMVLAQIEDVTDRWQAEQRLQRAALYDPLTDLPGRRLVLDRLQEALDDGPVGSVAVMFVDLDGFKLVNDALGHAAGDTVLIEVGRRLVTEVCPTDIVGRLGGDEFLVVCRDMTSRDEALRLAHRIERAIARPFPHAGDEVLLSTSVGVAFSGPDPRTPAELVHNADAAMYRAKQLGKRRFEVFDEAMRARAEARTRIQELLRTALQTCQVLVHYQPVVELGSGLVLGFEALARLCDTDGSVLLPAEFLDAAVETGLVAALDDAVFDLAVLQMARWRQELGYDLSVSVNVSAARITADLPERVLTGLAEVRLPLHRLVLEITEQSLIARGAAAEAALEELRHAGVDIALDDFGTGWASLTYLRRFPVTLVKIDRSFVDGVAVQHDDRVIVQAVIDLARKLGLMCTVEGIETDEQRLTVLGFGAHHGQGNLISPPLPPDQVPAWLADRDVRR